MYLDSKQRQLIDRSPARADEFNSRDQVSSGGWTKPRPGPPEAVLLSFV